MSLGDHHSLALQPDGHVWATAIMLPGLEVGGKHFVQMALGDVAAAAAGNAFNMVVQRNGKVWGMGRNYHGQIGDGTKIRKSAFVLARLIPGASAVAAGGSHSIVLTQQGDVWTSGLNKYGQLGQGPKSYSTRFRQVISGGAKVVMVSAGDMHSVVLRQDGSVWATGRNEFGQLGDGSNVNRNNFVRVMLGGAADVTAGRSHSVVLMQDGSVWATGCNEHGQLGDGSRVDRILYKRVVSHGVKAVAAGRQHTMMLKHDGSVWGAGYNFYGQLGDGSTDDTNHFVEVVSEGASAVAAGGLHTMVVDQDGSVWATGLNKDGQLGREQELFSRDFVKLDGTRDVVRAEYTRALSLMATPFLNHTTTNRIFVFRFVHMSVFQSSSCFYLPVHLFSFCLPQSFDNKHPHKTPHRRLRDGHHRDGHRDHEHWYKLIHSTN